MRKNWSSNMNGYSYFVGTVADVNGLGGVCAELIVSHHLQGFKTRF